MQHPATGGFFIKKKYGKESSLKLFTNQIERWFELSIWGDAWTAKIDLSSSSLEHARKSILSWHHC